MDLTLFSPQAIAEKQNRGLLLQFLISELLEAHQAHRKGMRWEAVLSSHPRFFPYDWACSVGFLNKAHEHALLLPGSFPEHLRSVNRFERAFSQKIVVLAKKKHGLGRSLKTLVSALEPLIKACKDNENLMFFLLKNRQEIDAVMQRGYLVGLLKKIHRGSMESLGEKMCDQYHQRGFFSQISEFKLLLAETCRT